MTSAPSTSPATVSAHGWREVGCARGAAEERRRRATDEIITRLRTAPPQEQQRLRQRLAEVNIAVARSVALRYRGRGINADDLVQVGSLGLVKAATRFDPTFERDFLAYAVPTITGEVKRYFRDCGWTIRPPRRIQETQAVIAKATESLTNQLQRSPTPHEVAQSLDLDEDLVIEALASEGTFIPASLDAPVGPSGTSTLAALLTSGDRELDQAEARVILGPAVRQLCARDRRIIELRFFEGWSQQRIGHEIGVTQMQVSRLLARILRELRAALEP